MSLQSSPLDVQPGFRLGHWVGALGIALFAAGHVLPVIRSPSGMGALDAIAALALAVATTALVWKLRGSAIPVERPRLVAAFVVVRAVMDDVELAVQPSAAQFLRAVGVSLLAVVLAPLLFRRPTNAPQRRER